MNGVSCSGLGMPSATNVGVHASLCLCIRAGPEGWEAGLVKNEDLGATVQGLERAQPSHGSSQAPQGWGQAAWAPDLCLTRRSQQLLQGADATLLCEGPQDIAGHQQDAADRSGDHQGEGRPPALSAWVRVVAAACVSPLRWGTSGVEPLHSFPPSVCYIQSAL